MAQEMATPGFRFYPTEEELVSCYLLRKVTGKPFLGFQPIVEIELYKSEPSELPALSPLKSKDMEWFFFNAVDRKNGSASRINRATRHGYWKSTGKDRPVKNISKTIIGMMKTLVFHDGRAPNGKRTNWVMHEYRLVDEQLEIAFVAQDAFVLCKVFQKTCLGPRNGTQYAPFVEEDWENDAALHIHAGGEADDDIPNGDVPRIGFINEEEMQKDKQKASLFHEDSLDPQRQSIDFLTKRRETSDDLEFLYLGPCKKPKHGDPNTSNVNGSDDSMTTIGGPSTKIMTNISSAALEFPLQLAKSKASQSSNLLDSSNLEKSVPPGFLKLMNNLENDIINVSVERDTLKRELRDAQEMIKNILTRTESLEMENERLRRFIRGSG